MSTIHICFGVSAYGTLRAVFRKQNLLEKESIICIEDDFSVGPLRQLTSINGMNERIEWVHSFLKQVEQISADDLTTITNYMLRNLTIPSQIPDGSTVILWHGQNASDSIGIRYAVSMLLNKNLTFQAIDITAFSVDIDYQIKDIEGNAVAYALKSGGALPPKLVMDAYRTKKILPVALVQDFMSQWEKWSQTEGTLRVYKNGEALTVSEEYYDAEILAHTSKTFKKAARVIGIVMGESDQCVGDTYLIYRVHELIKQGKLQYEGERMTLGALAIRLPV